MMGTLLWEVVAFSSSGMVQMIFSLEVIMKPFAARITSAILIFAAQSPAVSQPTDPIDQLYHDYKALENHFPIPTPTATVNVGTFDAATGRADALESIDIKGLHGELHHIIASADANAAIVLLKFTVRNAPQGAFVTAGSKSRIIPPGQSSTTISIGFDSHTTWTVRAAGHTWHDALVINRPHVIALGAFTVPVMPIAILYEPPQEPGVTAIATWMHSDVLGTTIGSSSSTEEVHATIDFDTLAAFQSKFGPLASAIGSAAGAPWVNVVVQGLNVLTSAAATTSKGFTSEQSVTNSGTLQTAYTFERDVTTSERRGPGVGDVFIYLRDARMIWLYDGQVRLALLGSIKWSFVSAKALADDMRQIESTRPTNGNGEDGGVGTPVIGKNSKLTYSAIQTLLALDPFVAGGPSVVLPPDRFNLVEIFSGAGANATGKVTYSVTDADTHSQVGYFEEVVDTKPGWLSVFGIGPSHEEKVTTRFTQGHSSSQAVGVVVQENIAVTSDHNEPYTYARYYDRVFGTFAFESPPPQTLLVVADGTATDVTGMPLATQRISLNIDGRLFTCTSDAQGRFSVKAPYIPRGKGTLSTGKWSQAISFSGAPVASIVLKKG